MKAPFINGPHTVTVHRLGDRIITIFGEIHNWNLECKHPTITMEQYIREYCRNKEDRQVDLYLESVYVPEASRGWFGIKSFHDVTTMRSGIHKLMGLRKLFDACSPKWSLGIFQDILYDCPSNLRVHLCDTRQIYGRMGALSEHQQKMLDIFFTLFHIKVDVIELLDEVRSEIVDFFGILLHDKKSPYYYTRFDRFLMNTLKIDRQIRAIKDKTRRTILLQYFQKKKQREIAKLQKIKEHSMWKQYTSLMNQYFEYQMNFMDMYLMARMLRHFKDGTTAQDIIIYVGDAHANVYRQVLRKLGARCLSSFPKHAQKSMADRIQQTCVRAPQTSD